MSRRSRSHTIVGFLALCGLLVGGCAEQLGLPTAETEQGVTVGRVFNLYLVVAYIVGAIVVGLIVFVIWRDRASRRGDGEGSQRHHNFALEITYTVIPFLVVIALTLVTLFSIGNVATTSQNPDLTVDVDAYQWGWRFTYTDSGVIIQTDADTPLPQLVLPASATIQFSLHSDDVIHSFWVPAFRFKRDLIPGTPTSFSVNTKEIASYDGHCAEFCGLQHAEMTFTVRTVDRQDFQTWLTDQLR